MENTKKQWLENIQTRMGGRFKNAEDLMFLFGDKDIKFDMHGHDNNSDGYRTPAEYLAEAEKNGVQVLSITNHDNILSQLAIENGTVDRSLFSGKIIPGAEVTCTIGSKNAECLIYGFDIQKARELIESKRFPYLNRDHRWKDFFRQSEERVAKANALGLFDTPLSMNDMVALEIPDESGKKHYEPISRYGIDAIDDLGFHTDDIKRKVEIDGKTYDVNIDYMFGRLFKYLVQSEKGREFLSSYSINVEEKDTHNVDFGTDYIPSEIYDQFGTFNRMMIAEKDGPFYAVSNVKPSIEQVIEFAKQTGAVTLLAHPFGYKVFGIKADGKKGELTEQDPNYFELREKQGIEMVSLGVQSGVDGIECGHGYCGPQEMRFIASICKDSGLLISGGSDTHKKENAIGYAPAVAKEITTNNLWATLLGKDSVGKENMHKKAKNKPAEEQESSGPSM